MDVVRRNAESGEPYQARCFNIDFYANNGIYMAKQERKFFTFHKFWTTCIQKKIKTKYGEGCAT